MKNSKEKRIRSITQLYYSRKDVQKAIFNFSKNRETVPRYFEGFGKRPDSFQYPGDVFELVKKGATSFHCSEEIWEDPLQIKTGMNEQQSNELREGWDLLIDIDCPWFDYSKKAAQGVIKVLKNHGVKNIGLKFSGSKGFHILVPWKAFPKEIAGKETKNLFPEVPRKVVSYIRAQTEKEMKEMLPEDFFNQFKETEIRKGIKCNGCGEISEKFYQRNLFCNFCKREETKNFRQKEETELKCPECRSPLKINNSKSSEFYECSKCKINSMENPDNFSKSVEIDLFELMGLDLVLVSPRHLFRTPYSLHEKTSLASIVISLDELEKFQPSDAHYLKAKVKNFMPECEEGEATKLLRESFDWESQEPKFETAEKKDFSSMEPLQISEISEKIFPPSIKKILEGLKDGKKRALFILLNFFRAIGMERAELEKRLYEWNKKNDSPLREGYIKIQISWSYRNKIVPPPNYEKDYYRGIGIIPTEEELRYKNPVNYVARKYYKNSNEKTKNKK